MRKKIICVIIFLLSLLFIIAAIIIQNKYYDKVLRIDYLITLGIFSVVMSVACFSNSEPRILKKHLKKIILTLCSICTVSIYILFFIFLPKYTVQDAYTIVRSDSRFVSGNITDYTSGAPFRISDKHRNPLAEFAYTFLWEHNEITELIVFDPNDGSVSLFEETP